MMVKLIVNLDMAQVKCLDQMLQMNPSEIRPTILMDITFNAFTYKDVEVGLDQRPRSGSDLLVNRDLMRLMNLSVNP